MIKPLLACVAVVAAILGGGIDTARAGGGHYVYIPIYIPGGQGWAHPARPNPQVDLPLELIDAPVEATEGVIGLHLAIARHTIRAEEAIVVDQPIEGGRRPIPAGTALAKVYMTVSGKRTELWCDMRRYTGLGTSHFECFSDSARSRKLDNKWSSLTSDEFFGFGGDEEIKDRGRMQSPVSYHAAKPEERPTGQIGYEWCGGDAVTRPPRFEVSASFSGGFWEESETHACPFGDWTDAGKTTVTVDAISIEVKPGPKPNTLAYKVKGRIAPMLIAHLEPGGPIRPREVAEELAAAEKAMLMEQALMPMGTPASVASGEIAPGQVIYSLSVKHGATGVLANAVWLGKYTLFGQAPPPDTPSLKAGQIVYARRVTDSQTVHTVWCAPRKSGSEGWTDAVCFPNDGTGYVWIEAKPALLVGDLTIPAQLRNYATPPIVTRQPVDLPPLTLSYVLRAWNKDSAKIDGQVDWGEGPQTFKSYVLKVGVDGAVALPVTSGRVAIRPGATAGSADVQFEPVKPSAAAGRTAG